MPASAISLCVVDGAVRALLHDSANTDGTQPRNTSKQKAKAALIEAGRNELLPLRGEQRAAAEVSIGPAIRCVELLSRCAAAVLRSCEAKSGPWPWFNDRLKLVEILSVDLYVIQCTFIWLWRIVRKRTVV
jgi:hypothetical protein